jgi:hypothetical protein
MMPSRRRLLAAAGALPFLPYLASAAPGPAPQRLVLFLGPLNGLQPGWEPQGSGATAKLSSRLAPLAPFQSRLTIINGLNGPVQSFQDGHKQAMAGLWTGSALSSSERPTSASLDQLLAARLSLPTPFKTLEFGVMSDQGLQGATARMIFGPGGNPIAPESSPERVYARVFGAPVTVGRTTVFDAVKRQLSLVRDSVSVEDRHKLEAHLESLQAIEKRLSQTSTCTAKAPATVQPTNDAFPTLYQQQLELMVMALACDRTRIASFQPSTSISTLRMGWVPGITGDFHFGTMHGGTEAQRVALNEWFVQRFVDLLRALDSVKEGEGTLLDHTTVVWAGEMAAGDHRNWPLPVVMAGGPSSGFRLGQTLVVDRASYTRVLQAVLHSFRVTDVRLGTYDTGEGPLPGLLA